MVNKQGLASYCQECGACAACTGATYVPGMDSQLVDTIVNQILQSVQPGFSAETSRSPYPLIPLGVSNRHAHLTRETLEILFGQGTDLENMRALYQPSDFAAKQTITIVGSKMRAIQNVRILGPLRKYDQVELSLTDAIQIGVKPPVRNSGDLHDAAPLTLVGPKGSVHIEKCAIIASRHLHMTNQDAAVFGIVDGDLCKVRIGGEKATTFENVLVRTNDAWKLQLHLDTDDANAANVRCNTQVEFVGKM